MSGQIYKRDQVFWLAALQTGVFGIFMGGFGPALPLLQADQGTSAAVAGLHGTAMGISSIIAGSINARVAHRFGRPQSVWLGLIIFNIGAMSFIVLPKAWQTIPAILIAGIGMSLTITNSLMNVSGHYKSHAPRAVSQANGVNSAFVLLGNFIIGVIAGSQFSWRLGLLVCLPFAIILYLTLGRQQRTEHIPDTEGHQTGSLPLKYWLSWIGMMFCIAAEFAVAFWAAALFREKTDLSAALSTTLVLAFPCGMMIGRWFGTHIFPTMDIDDRLRAIIALQGGGFALFWFSTNPWLSFTALFIVGLGTSMQFALSSLRLLRFGREKPDLAIGKSSLSAGIAIGLSPLLLGLLADRFGIVQGFLLVPALIICAFVIVTLVPSKSELISEEK
ncbi:MAG TPA: MFS transporter [Candidatus Nanopelagicaceae bacterium]|nr:MFS transporter [Candidatus Nanopelagicaceae bacterium]